MTILSLPHAVDWRELHESLEAGDADGVMRVATSTLLDGVRRGGTAFLDGLEHDEEFVRVRSRLHEDPHSSRGFHKPRGYPGDAVLLDLIYETTPIPEDTTPIGEGVYRWCCDRTTAFAAVRGRRDHLAALIDETARRRPGARVLSVACGHLREAARSEALNAGGIRELVAFDQDPRSLAVVRATAAPVVRPVEGSVSQLLKGKAALGEFDLIYAAGLCDYLPQPVATALTHRLAAMLAPGGTLVLGNFKELWERGYMEAVMRWHLLYRTEADVAAWGEGLTDCRVATYTDAHDVLAYLRVERM